VTDTDTAEKPDVVGPPRTIVAAFALTIAHVVLSIVNSAMLWGYQDYLRGQLVKSNNKLIDKHDKKAKDYTSPEHGLHNLNHDLHSGLNVGLIQIAVFSLLVLLLAVNFRKGRGWARWAEILVLVIVVQAPFRLFNLGGDAPLLMRGVSALVGLTGIAVIVLLVVPESSRYFAGVRGVRVGDRASGAASMGFRGLFGPRTPPSDDDASPTKTTAAKPTPTRPARPARAVQTRPAARPPATVPDDKPVSAAKAPKAKVRATAEASGAEGQSGTAKPAGSGGGGAAAKSRGKSRRGI